MALSRNKTLCLLTLNTHSLMHEDNEGCLQTLADLMIREQADVVALQEVNQKTSETPAEAHRLSSLGFVSCGSARPVREGNYALRLSQILSDRGRPYAWTWGFAHEGYATFDEGLALFSSSPILETRLKDISRESRPGARIIRRRLAGIRTALQDRDAWFWCLHMGWWSDDQDPFIEQWNKARSEIEAHPGPAYLMGDFNNPADHRGEGYDVICSSGYEDCFVRASERDEGYTVPGEIDGWRKGGAGAMRLDMVFARQKGRTLASRTVLTGAQDPCISDHFGVLDIEVVPE